ncbi:hypothetical protein LXA43DRAFT_1052357 [Ganoderma leucocontextum]|nr:hypothetical protein LXA43DRAFT_1052357 [Ganoderma leucocontextum]
MAGTFARYAVQLIIGLGVAWTSVAGTNLWVVSGRTATKDPTSNLGTELAHRACDERRQECAGHQTKLVDAADRGIADGVTSASVGTRARLEGTGCVWRNVELLRWMVW